MSYFLKDGLYQHRPFFFLSEPCVQAEHTTEAVCLACVAFNRKAGFDRVFHLPVQTNLANDRSTLQAAASFENRSEARMNA